MRHPAGLATLALVSGIALAVLPAMAQESPEPAPFARTRMEPGPSVTVGQPVTVAVEVLVPSWFTAAPWFPDLDVADAIAVYEDRGINFTEKIDGRTWAGQSRNYHVYPQRPGSFEIEAIPVQVRYLSQSTGPRTRATVSPPPVRFAAVVPAGAEGLPYFIGTTSLTIEQSFDRQPTERRTEGALKEPGTGGPPARQRLRVGEAFTRTITVTVRDALGMVIPPLAIEAIPGLAAYPEPPEVSEVGGERGEPVAGIRVERATWVAEAAGDYRLPEVELIWWDVGAQRLRTATLPALEVQVEPNPDLAAEIPLPPDEAGPDAADAAPKARVALVDLLRRWGLPLAGTALGLLLIVRLWRRAGPIVAARVAEGRRRRRESEPAYFRRFRRAAFSGDPKAAWNAWTAWLDRHPPGAGAATIRAFVDAAGDPDLERQAGALGARLFGAGGGSWCGKALVRSVAAARRRARRQRPGARELPGSLNPGRDANHRILTPSA